MKKLEIDGISESALADRVGDSIWIHFRGQTFSVAVNETRKHKRGQHGDKDISDIHAPMPGKVTQILFQVGDTIKRGQTVAVMEAMKMEYNLKASVEGTIVSVSAKVGEQVSLGKLLIEIKPGGE